LKEWSNNIQVNSLQHENLMSTFGAFEYGDQFFLLMEEAEMNLEEYFKSDGKHFTPQELWEQVYKVTQGLARLHGNADPGGANHRICYHKDLKPSNILIVKKIMKIADFGLMHVKDKMVDESPDSNSSGVDDELGWQTYRAPTTSLRFHTESDLWSWGAIVSEIATFDIRKKDGLRLYRNERNRDFEDPQQAATYNFHRDEVMKRSVTENHKMLKERVRMSEQSENREPLEPFQKRFYTDHLFDIIEQMLRKGRTNPREILRANSVAEQLKNHHTAIVQQIMQDSTPENPTLPSWNVWEDTKYDHRENNSENKRIRMYVHICYH
jgi:serine/threonine protein kinase